MDNVRTVYTVGHSTQPLESFLSLLKLHCITAVADVRSSPYSRHVPQYSREDLKQSLKENGFAYVFLGDELGARSKDDRCYINDVVSYDRLSKTPIFQQGVQRVIDGSGKFSIALMCSERDPTECHRTLLVSKSLVERGMSVSHILGNGDLETHESTMLRVLDLLGMPREDMLHSREELIAEAYKGRERQVAYRRKG
jgi:uncharacterized protein (DUF488 family)